MIGVAAAAGPAKAPVANVANMAKRRYMTLRICLLPDEALASLGDETMLFT
jgi:hypothetical protein